MTDYDVDTFFFIIKRASLFLLKTFFVLTIYATVICGSVILFAVYLPIPMEVKVCLLLIACAFASYYREKHRGRGANKIAKRQLEEMRNKRQQNEQLYSELLKKQNN